MRYTPGPNGTPALAKLPMQALGVLQCNLHHLIARRQLRLVGHGGHRHRLVFEVVRREEHRLLCITNDHRLDLGDFPIHYLEPGRKEHRRAVLLHHRVHGGRALAHVEEVGAIGAQPGGRLPEAVADWLDRCVLCEARVIGKGRLFRIVRDQRVQVFRDDVAEAGPVAGAGCLRLERRSRPPAGEKRERDDTDQCTHEFLRLCLRVFRLAAARLPPSPLRGYGVTGRMARYAEDFI